MKTLELRYFARLRDALGCQAERVDVPADIDTPRQLIAWLRQRGGAWDSELSGQRPFRVAINQDMSQLDDPIPPGAEVAIFPPVTGG
ncbi:MoaD/ThiS family protein [Amantichitinum ursilacus]|uniref:Molybdopterin synthase sulfur carrier subunit n=1 Tax=Amantichitinum ursilacus TaxID=857265 RepID=A0A0N0GKX8_9NEIS|nr:MoaD/ThiS family protein [Amantichitinum ursilacus]KPC49366.1 Molybdopterin synthase sulfur carrier subunit [Amantichitinum ursilacus]